MMSVSETQPSCTAEEDQSTVSTSHGYVLPEGKIMPNTVFVGGIDIRMDEIEIKEFFSKFGLVKEVKIITDRNGVSKGYGFVSFYDDVDVQKIVDSQINFHGKKLKLGPAIRKQQNACSYAQPRPVLLNPPAPQFHSVWNNPNVDPYIHHQMVSPMTQYVQACPYPSSTPVMFQQYPLSYQQPGYYQVPPHWQAGDHQRSYVFPPAFTLNYPCGEIDQSIEIMQDFPMPEQAPSPSSPQKKSVDRSIQTVVSCLLNPENRLQRSFISQEDRRTQFRRKAIFKTVAN